MWRESLGEGPAAAVCEAYCHCHHDSHFANYSDHVSHSTISSAHVISEKPESVRPGFQGILLRGLPSGHSLLSSWARSLSLLQDRKSCSFLVETGRFPNPKAVSF